MATSHSHVGKQAFTIKHVLILKVYIYRPRCLPVLHLPLLKNSRLAWPIGLPVSQVPFNCMVHHGRSDWNWNINHLHCTEVLHILEKGSVWEDVTEEHVCSVNYNISRSTKKTGDWAAEWYIHLFLYINLCLSLVMSAAESFYFLSFNGNTFKKKYWKEKLQVCI